MPPLPAWSHISTRTIAQGPWHSLHFIVIVIVVAAIVNLIVVVAVGVVAAAAIFATLPLACVPYELSTLALGSDEALT